MHDAHQDDYARQSRLVRALHDALGLHAGRMGVKLCETHISWVLLAGSYAYKIKKSVDLGFLNFNSLEARFYYCKEEIRLNRRLAPGIYLDVIAIGGTPEHPVLGAQEPIEYAVRMRRFAVSRQLDRMVTSHKILPAHIDSLAATIAHFHNSLPAAEAGSPFANAESVARDAAQNFQQLKGLLEEQDDIASLLEVHRASDKEYASCRKLFDQRVLQGCVRECHGDLHLGNIVLVAGLAIPFDCIEFAPALRWIDVMSEVAFVVMDLLHYRRADLAYRFLNAYLGETGDYAGIALLRYYLAYRAMVRAKVSAIRAVQEPLQQIASVQALDDCRAYLGLAANCLLHKQAALLITHGLPGSGKSTFAQIALERWQAIRLRSDVERKRLHGLSALADSHASGVPDLYSSEITQQTYARLLELARGLLLAGATVIVDAAFLRQEQRDLFRRLAAELSVPFAIASMQADNETLRGRIVQRQRAANDASEADLAVLEKLQRICEDVSAVEADFTAEFGGDRAGTANSAAAWSVLHRLLGR